MNIGILTGGGDAPGLNGIIESVSKCLLFAGHQVTGIQDGFEGIFNSHTVPITLKEVRGLHSLAGTFLGTSNRCGTKGREQEFLEKYAKLGLDGMVVAGGDGTFGGLRPFAEKIPIIGIPKTIDNDLPATDICFGYDTACSVVADSIDALRATADAHRRVIVVETMGRTAGWIALGGGLASYADAILIPERPFNREKLLAFIRKHQEKGDRGFMIAVSEGARAENEETTIAFEVAGSPQAERFGGIAFNLARWIEKETSWESRHVVLGHLQRAHQPTTTDRFLTLAMGVVVAKMVQQKAWGETVVYRDGKVRRTRLEELMGPPRLVHSDHRWVHLAQALGLFI